MLATAPSDRFESAAAVLQALATQKQVSQLKAQAPTIIQSAPPKNTQSSIQVPPPIASPQMVNAPSKPAKIRRSHSTPWLLSATIPTQFIAAFLLGFETMLLGQVALSLLESPTNWIVLVVVMGAIATLRITSILDNKDLFVFVNVLSIIGFLIAKNFAKVAIPDLLTILPFCAVAGVAAIAMMAALRLIFKILNSLL
jgi:serine/threonine-protein kinase